MGPTVFRLFLVFTLSFSILPPAMGSRRLLAAVTQSSLSELENKLKSQYAAIEEEIARPPSPLDHPSDYRQALRAWQDQLANRFSDAAATVEEILKVNPVNAEMWRERLETLRVYGKPISPPGTRTVFGKGEVDRAARILNAPAAVYTDLARANNTRGDVRLRLILAADGTVKNVFGDQIPSLRFDGVGHDRSPSNTL